jgi:putative sugar O-methyltransferase
MKSKIIEAAKQLPSYSEGTSNHWNMVRTDIKNKIINDNLDNFLNWYNVKETMVVTSQTLAEYEYNILKSSPRWNLYQEAIKGLTPGNPIPSKVYPESNNNAIHQLYHLHMYESKYGPIENVSRIVEFGGGYGCLCSIIKRLGFKGLYTIIDLPEFHLLQKYYLNSLGIYDVVQTTTPNTMLFEDATFFAFWSLSETEIGFRINFIDTYLPKLNNFLMAYQVSYEGQDNIQSFDRIKAYIPFDFSEVHLEHIPQNYYLFGNKK